MSHDGNFDRLDAGREFCVGMENAPCMRTFQYRSEPSGLRNPQTSAQLFGMDPGPPGGVRKAQSENTSSIVLILSRLRQRQAAPSKSPATKSMF